MTARVSMPTLSSRLSPPAPPTNLLPPPPKRILEARSSTLAASNCRKQVKT